MKNIHNIKILFYIFIFVVFSVFVNACNTGEIDSTNNKYCDINGVWISQEANGASCQNDFECLIGSCKTSICQEFDIIESVGEQQSVIQSIIDYFYPASTGGGGSNGGGSGTPSICGNYDRESGEVCDRTDLQGKNCFILGFTGGTLKCSTNCTAWNTTGCYVNTPQAPQPVCTPVCSSTCGGESSGCGTTCIYNDGAYCEENKVCSNGNCIEQLGCKTDSDCMANEICQSTNCVTKPKNKSILPTILIVLLLLAVIGAITFLIIKKKKPKGVIIDDKAKKPEEKKNYY